MTVEFDCPDCRWHVIYVVGEVPESSRCATCELISGITDPAAREVMRAAFASPPPLHEAATRE
jgi:hypothetical protein